MRTKNTRKIAILGSGIVSNLATKLLKDTIVFTKKRTPIFLDNVFIHDTIENRLMLMLFGIDFKSKLIPVYYQDYKTGLTTQTLTNEISEIISREKMGDSTKTNQISGMSITQSDFRNLLFDEKEFISLLTYQSESLAMFPDKIVEYSDFVRVQFGNFGYADFEYVINTIPQPFFSNLISDNSTRFNYQPLIFITVKTEQPDMMMYSYNGGFWKRQFIKGGSHCFEFEKDQWDEGLFDFLYPTLGEKKITEILYGRIKSVEVHDTPRIKHIGRFAQWNHSITTEHSVNKLINLNL